VRRGSGVRARDWGIKKKRPGGARRLDASIYEGEYSPLGRTCQYNNRQECATSPPDQNARLIDRADKGSSVLDPYTDGARGGNQSWSKKWVVIYLLSHELLEAVSLSRVG